MSQVAVKHWTPDEFFAWQERQDQRYELVGGLPLKMMAGALNRHDTIVVNLLAELRNRLRGQSCVPFTADGAVQTYPGQIRRPDVGVDCGRRDPDGYLAADVRMVVEVLSPSTRDFDTYGKIAEYKAIGSLEYIMIVEPNAAEVVLWSRDGTGAWSDTTIDDMAGAVALPSLGVTLPLAEMYDGVAFPTGVRLTLS